MEHIVIIMTRYNKKFNVMLSAFFANKLDHWFVAMLTENGKNKEGKVIILRNHWKILFSVVVVERKVIPKSQSTDFISNISRINFY